jgi:two-component system cell cycle response regulator
MPEKSNEEMIEPAGWNEPVAPRTLVVEDDPDQRQLICDTLTMYFSGRDGTEVVGVSTGAECMAQDLDRFDAILLDYQLPDTSGLKLLGKILEARDVPIIFVTGNNSSTTAAEAIRAGAQDYVIKLGDYLFALPVVVEKNIRLHQLKRENAELQTRLKASLEEIQVKKAQLEESLLKLRRMAATDHLTGLANRRAFAEVLVRCHSEATRYEFDLSCAMLDLDHFKALNDTLGHMVGDNILQATAKVVRANLRGSDTAARYGGDEFVLLLPHTSVEMALNVAERICHHQDQRGREPLRRDLLPEVGPPRFGRRAGQHGRPGLVRGQGPGQELYRDLRRDRGVVPPDWPVGHRHSTHLTRATPPGAKCKSAFAD